MKKNILIIILLLFSIFLKAQTYNDTLDVVTWNLRLFGSDTLLPNQASNVKNVMNQIGADIYACQEVINVDSFKWVANNLNGNFGYYYSYYGAGASDTSNWYYPNSLKYGFLYRKSMVGNITVKPLLKTSSSALINFRGLFPFLVKCDIKGADNNWSPFYFVIIHPPCCSVDSNCNKRINAIKELKDTLDMYYPNNKLMIIGDFNDDIDTTICTNSNTSTYNYLITDTINYDAITLPYSHLGIGSVIGYNNMIDHIVISNEVKPFYINNSIKIITNYTWANTSDHHPVKAQFVFPNGITNTQESFFENITIYPNPTNQYFYIKFDKKQEGKYEIFNSLGTSINRNSFDSQNMTIDFSNLPNGLYSIVLTNNIGKAFIQKIIVNH